MVASFESLLKFIVYVHKGEHNSKVVDVGGPLALLACLCMGIIRNHHQVLFVQTIKICIPRRMNKKTFWP
jgi:hypothetical protein